MRTTTVLAVAGVWLAVWDAGAQTINQGAVMQEAAPLGDAEFVGRAAIANRFEIEEAGERSLNMSPPRGTAIRAVATAGRRSVIVR